MSDRYRTIIVTLRESLTADDARPVVDAIRLLGAVASAKLGPVDDFDARTARLAAACEVAATISRVCEAAACGDSRWDAIRKAVGE